MPARRPDGRPARAVARALTRACAALSLAALAACYRTAPVGDAGGAAPPAEGRRVVVSLTTQGTQEMAAQLGPGVVRAEGVVTGAGPDAIELALTRTEQAGGTDQLWQRQRVRVPRGAVASLAERRIDRGRSWFAAAGIVALAALAASLLGGTLGGDRSGPIESGPG